jgi:hypothetical protein
MVVHNRDVMRVAIEPTENQSPLLIDSNRVKADEVARQGLEPIARRPRQLVKLDGGIQYVQLPERRCANFARDPAELTNPSTMVQRFRGAIPERDDHSDSIPLSRYPCNRSAN